MPRLRCRAAGFTLVEAIIAIVITGIVAGMVAVFIKSPIDAYVDTARRAELTDVADTALRRIGRDIRLALPNSVRNPVDGSDLCLEFMPTKIGGRYRAAQTSGGTGDILDFTVADTGFDMLWPNSSLPAADRLSAGDIVVVYNDGYAGNAYMGTNAIKVAAAPTEPGGTANSTAIAFVDATTGAPFHRKQLPAESPSYRFQVIPSAGHVVGYACSGGNLLRYSRILTVARSQPANCGDVATGASSATLAGNIANCSLKYEPPGSGTNPNGRHGMVSITLEIAQGGESVQLYHQVHVDNTP